VEWLRRELDKRGWSQNELARRAGLTSGSVSQVMTGLRRPGVEFCQGVARAFKISETVVFVEAGVMSPARNASEVTLQELYDLLKDLPVSEQRAILAEARERWESVHGESPPQLAPSTSQ